MTCEESHKTMYTIFVLLLTFFVNCGIIYFCFSTLKEATCYNDDSNTQVVLTDRKKEESLYGNIKSGTFK